MATITADTCGQHDTSAGCCSCESNVVRFGEETRYQHACRENFILELGRRGLWTPPDGHTTDTGPVSVPFAGVAR